MSEKSPYLLQHARNPVDWYPWGEEAFTKARVEDKPIFLSIGYSTCHWCHVMEHESFEDPGIAAILNEHFVPIKVDREERPDVDRIYMTSLQAMGQNGGWPLSMFLTPDLRPFYGGTYYPPSSRYGRAGFPDVLRRIHEAWTTERAKVQDSAGTLSRFLTDVASAAGSSTGLPTDALVRCQQQLSKTYDPAFGGFGGGPKFPRPVVFGTLLRHWFRTNLPASLEMTERTLQKMALGGMYDHIGGGFHRYSVDGEWRVPHFEKMLYDQAQLVTAYVEAYQATGNPFYAAVVNETALYVLGELTGSEGAFLSAEDADSPRTENPEEQGEGAFYVWTKDEIDSVLGGDAPLFCFYYGIEKGGNAPFDPQMEFTGRNILYVAHTVADTARTFQRDETEVKVVLALARKTLSDVRRRRPRPHRDDKVITSWNGLMVGALSRAGAALHNHGWIDAAARACDFVLSRLREPETGGVLRRYRDGEVRFAGQLDDYANLAWGLLELFEATSHARWLEEAIAVTNAARDRFEDAGSGAFFDTPPSDASVLVRLKEQYDGAEPTGNSVMVMNLVRLGHLTGTQRWFALAERAAKAFSGMMASQPVVMPHMVSAVDALQTPPVHIVIAGRRGEPETERLVEVARRGYVPGRMIIVTGDGEEHARLARLAPYLADVQRASGLATAYLCRDLTCGLPTTDPVEFERALSSDTQARA
jgi:uncharacterized protein YyaL (SSP411 family)